jgi:nitroreductase
VDAYEALYTTRMMRRMRPDEIPLEVQARILDAAIRAPNGRWGVAANRRPVHEVSSRNRWHRPFGVEVPGPLWPPE